MSVKLIFSFDSEDYITPEAADAERWWAETMTRHGITACICLVGELARSLRDRGRRDVLDAMACHEICYHSDMHSAPPTHAVYLDSMTWEQGMAAVREREARGLADTSALFGRSPSAYCKPGASWGAQVSVAMAEFGVPVFCDAPFEWERGRLMWYAGQLCTAYHAHFDGYFETPDAERLPRMKADFERRCAAHDGGVLVMYTHPCRLVTTQFWDGVNFAGGADPPRAQWRPAPLRTAEKIETLKRDFDAFLGWVVGQPNVSMTTYSALHASHRQPAARWISRTELLRLSQAVGDPPEPVRTESEWLSPAEIFGLIARALAAYSETGSLPEAVAVRRLLGPTQAIPEASVGPIELSAAALLAVAREADAHASATGTMPSRVSLGEQIGPNSFLQAARVALERIGNNGAGFPTASVFRLPSTEAETTSLAQKPNFRDMRFRGGWSIFPPDFEGRNVIDMARLQTWTGKPAVER
jgi:hypothetical protein